MLPLHIELDAFLNQSYAGIKDIKLGNGYADPSLIREPLAYSILGNYMDCPRSNFARLYINDVYIGLYANDESIGKSFCSSHFASSTNTFAKCNPLVNPGPTTKSSLRYINSDSTTYRNYYEVKSTYGWNELINLFDTVTNQSGSIESIMDIDRAVWMLAFNNVLINLDSYSGVFCQNYYIYKDNNNRFNPIVWDLNMAFGGFPFLGSGNTGMGGLTIPNMQQLAYNVHATDPYWPLINAVFNNATLKRMYIAHMRTLLNEEFASNKYQVAASTLQTLIDTDVLADTNKFFTYTDFQNAMTQNTVNGSYSVPGITTLMASRASYLQGTPEFQTVPPAVSNITPSNTSPVFNSQVTITATIIDPSVITAYLGYRFNTYDRFIKLPLYDDGLHNDGAANDQVYGATFQMTGYQAQYYIYAENNSAGIFSPENAEYRFHVLTSSVQTAAAGQIVINEFLAINQADTVDESNQHEDWIELYNLSNVPLNMDGLFLSDDYNNAQKFAFPSGTIINATDYLMIWADEDISASTPSNLHCNFKLSGSGERIILSNINGDVLDSISFEAATSDISTGRCPNGTGTFIALENTTYKAANCPVGIESIRLPDFTAAPNPCTDFVIIKPADTKSHTLTLSTLHGQKLFIQNFSGEKSISTAELKSGIYFLSVDGKTIKLNVQH